jgi:hypothetical protein
LKNNTLHKQLKEFHDKWFRAEKDLIQQKLEFSKMVNQIPENREKLGDYLNVDVEKMISDLIEEDKKMGIKRRHIMDEFPFTKADREQSKTKTE